MLCCQLQLPQQPWKELKLYFYAIFNLALMGTAKKRQINQLYSMWFNQIQIQTTYEKFVGKKAWFFLSC